MSLELPAAPRLLVEVDLQPLQGTRFQPTGFPDVGAGTYELPDKTPMLLVESAQSVANRLEGVCWDEASNDLHPVLAGLPYVRVDLGEGITATNTILEAHRLNSAYVEKSTAFELVKTEIGFSEKKPMDREKFLRTLLKYDPSCLLHGVFLESIAGVLRVPRALGGFIEAKNVRVAATGGVKNDRVAASRDLEGGATAKEGFGNVPFHRDEYVAEAITGYFNLDLDQLRGYRLGADVERLLYVLAVWKIRSFLARGLRLRTACDLDVRGEPRVTRPAGAALLSLSEVEGELPRLIAKVAADGKLASPPVTVGKFGGAGKAKAR